MATSLYDSWWNNWKLKVFQSELLITEKDLNWNFTDILHGVLVAGLSNPKPDIKKAIIKYKKEN